MRWEKTRCLGCFVIMRGKLDKLPTGVTSYREGRGVHVFKVLRAMAGNPKVGFCEVSG